MKDVPFSNQLILKSTNAIEILDDNLSRLLNLIRLAVLFLLTTMSFKHEFTKVKKHFCKKSTILINCNPKDSFRNKINKK